MHVGKRMYILHIRQGANFVGITVENSSICFADTAVCAQARISGTTGRTSLLKIVLASSEEKDMEGFEDEGCKLQGVLRPHQSLDDRVLAFPVFCDLVTPCYTPGVTGAS